MRTLAAFFALALLAVSQPASAAPEFGTVRNFGPDLSARCNQPEGIAADPRGNIYASSLNFAGTSPSANICVLDHSGAIVDTIAVAPAPGASSSNLLGMLYVPGEGLYVADIGGGRVVRIDVATHAATTIATGFQAPNALAKDNAGNLWVSDSFRGGITRIAPDGTRRDFDYPAQLRPTPGEFPPFGANGIAFDRDQTYLYVAMTARDQVFRIAYADGALGAISLFATGTPGGALDGADGIAFDVQGELYVCSNQSNEVTVLDGAGQVIAEVRGTGGDSFHDPASLVFRGRDVYVADLSLFDGGTGQKVSTFTAPYAGAPLRP